jgi:NADH-quinone oxidoreductase subunit M
MVMAGGFEYSGAMMVLVVPGVVLAAAYMLRMLQKLAYGGTRNPDHSGIGDLGFREIVTLTPLFFLVFYIGLHPAPFTRVMKASVDRIVQQAAAGSVASKVASLP